MPVYRANLRPDSKVPAPYLAVSQYFSHDPISGVDRYGKANSLGLVYHGCVYTDNPAFAVDKRASGAAGIKRNIGLYDILN